MDGLRVSTVIFDLDGTLLDSGRTQAIDRTVSKSDRRRYEEFLKKKYGKHTSDTGGVFSQAIMPMYQQSLCLSLLPRLDGLRDLLVDYLLFRWPQAKSIARIKLNVIQLQIISSIHSWISSPNYGAFQLSTIGFKTHLSRALHARGLLRGGFHQKECMLLSIEAGKSSSYSCNLSHGILLGWANLSKTRNPTYLVKLYNLDEEAVHLVFVGCIRKLYDEENILEVNTPTKEDAAIAWAALDLPQFSKEVVTKAKAESYILHQPG
ncbi:hypothetical protein HPP92_007967 [Vanilla planifolia]|uniref:Uncharacterized protein n=1 Tax=Vanilla planifolia TaxID=51239 RepID=A0A835RB81_VANPL|nr:hypothetical protein HPP92_007967 [Vanilla planifolia]